MKPSELILKFANICYDEYNKKQHYLLIGNRVTSNFSNKELKQIYSDPIWVNLNPKHFIAGAEPIRVFLSILFRINHPSLEIFTKNCVGALLRIGIKQCNDSRLESLISRGLKSEDYKVRREAAKRCAPSKLKALLKDPKIEVRRVAIKRIGFNNIPDILINDKSVDIRLRAAIMLDRQDVLKEILVSESKKVSVYTKNLPWPSQYRLMEIVSRMNKKDILYNLDVKGKGSYLDQILEIKLDQKE